MHVVQQTPPTWKILLKHLHDLSLVSLTYTLEKLQSGTVFNNIFRLETVLIIKSNLNNIFKKINHKTL